MYGSMMSRWIEDPTFDDHDLSDYLCGPSAPNNSIVTCPQMRNCSFDATLGTDPLLNGTCPDGCYTCLHKTLWPMAPDDFLTFAALFVCGILAGASGIGGGGLNVPLLMLAGGFLVSEAVPLSHVMVFGNAIAQNLINAPRTHPHSTKRPLIDLDVPLLMLPAQLGGNTIGVLLGPVLPASAVESLAIVLLGYAALKTLYTASKAYKKESAETAAAQLIANTTNATSSATTGFDAPSTRTAVKPLLSGEAYPIDREAGGSSDEHPAGSAPAAIDESSACPVDFRLLLLMGLWLALVLDFLGSHKWGGHGGICSAPRLAWLFGQLGVVAIASAMGGLFLYKIQFVRDANGEPVLPGDTVWKAKNTISLPFMGFLVGVVAGLLGLGGGELMAPLLLAIGMLPQVASATSACMVLFTSSADIAHYAFQGILTPDPGYVSTLLCLGFLSAFIGRTLALKLVRRLSHPSYIAFVLGFVLLGSLSLLVVQVMHQKVDWNFAPLCH